MDASNKIYVPKGLAGVVADESAVSKVMAESNSLTYRGYPVEELSAHCSFEEVAYLLIYGELPNVQQKEAFLNAEKMWGCCRIVLLFNWSPTGHHTLVQM